MSPPETRPSLIVRLRSEGNELAWAEFILTYEPFLKHLIQRRGIAQDHVPDVTQQVLLAVARSVKNWQDDGNPASFRRWLSGVARNVTLKFLAREQRQVEGRGGTHFHDLLAQIPDTGEEAARQYEHELVVWAAEQVRAEFRESSWKAFWATLVDGRAVNDVAKELGVTPGSIYMSRSRIMARIRGKVKEVLGE